MKLTDQFRTGWRNLTRQKLRSVLTIFAIVIGAISVTVMLSLVTSARNFMTSSFQKTGEDRRVIVTPTPGLDYRESSFQTFADGSGVKLTDEVVRMLRAIPGVKSATPILGWGFFESVVHGDLTVTMKNTNTIAYEPNGTVVREVVAGRLLQPTDDGKGVLISTDLAGNLGFRSSAQNAIGATLTLVPRKDAGPQSNFGPIDVTVVGVVISEGSSIETTLNSAMHFMPVFERCEGGPGTQPTCTKETEISRNGYGSIYLDVGALRQVDQVMIDAQKLKVGVAAGKDEIKNQQQVFTIIGAVLGGIGAIALFVAAIGVINTMVMATLERTREIGIMRAIGATKRTIRRLFTIEAGVLGFLGGAIGVGASFALTLVINKVVNQQLADNGMSARDVVQVPIVLALLVIGVTTAIGMLAGRLPARRAANLDPVEALRHE